MVQIFAPWDRSVIAPVPFLGDKSRMPLLESSDFNPLPLLRNAHVQTIGRLMIRRAPVLAFRRERLELEDGDFLDLDFIGSGSSQKLVILSHGLEGSSKNSDIRGMAATLAAAGWDVLAWNLRGCSDEPNRLPRSYHSGSSDDLAAVVRHVLKTGQFSQIDFVGFSLGGNITLKFLGECGEGVSPQIGAAVAFSVPCDLGAGARRLEHWSNRIYLNRFLRSLRRKVREKIRLFPGQVFDHDLDRIRTFREFDAAYTAPLNGFASAQDYWSKAACLPVLHKIAVPTLLVNARNDPFLTPSCYPWDVARESHFFHLEVPRSGGHLGFVRMHPFLSAWSESRALEFLGSSQLPTWTGSGRGRLVGKPLPQGLARWGPCPGISSGASVGDGPDSSPFGICGSPGQSASAD